MTSYIFGISIIVVIKMTVGDRIKLQREVMNISQTDLAYKVGISKQTLYKYEKNIVTNIPSDKIEKIADALSTTPQRLMGWKEDAPSEEDIDQHIIDVYGRLSPERQKQALEYLAFLAAQEQAEN